MKSNISYIDRVVRILIAVLAVILYYNNVISGTMAAVVMVIAGILLLTSIINFCPLYHVFGISSKIKEKP